MQITTLEGLLAGLEKQAAAADEDKEKRENPFAKKDKEDDEKEEKAEDKEDDAAKKLKSAGKDLEDAKKMEEQVKEAQLQGAALAQEIMQKMASATTPTTTKEPEMNKQASAAGKTLASAILEKLATDMTTHDGIGEGVPSRIQMDSARMVAEHDARIQPTPTKDAMGNGGGTVNQIFDAIIADAMGAGAASVDQVHSTGIDAVEGAPEDHATNADAVQADEVEKVAAVNALMNSGYDMFSAVEMVKAAEEEIFWEEDQQVKQAALGELMGQGFDFETAAALVKEAAAGEVARGVISPAWMEHNIADKHGKEGPKGFGANVGAHARGIARAQGRNFVEGAAGSLGGAALGALAAAALRKDPRVGAILGSGAGAIAGGFHGTVKSLKNQAGEMHQKYASALTVLPGASAAAKKSLGSRLMANKGKIAAGAAGAAGVGALAAGGAALSREKQAAVSGLVEAGVDFESAVDLVAAKSQALYGA